MKSLKGEVIEAFSPNFFVLRKFLFLSRILLVQQSIDVGGILLSDRGPNGLTFRIGTLKYFFNGKRGTYIRCS